MKKSALFACILFSFFLSSFSICSYTQNINGKWYGLANADVPEGGNAYLGEFILEQKGNKVTGYFNYYFRNGYFTNNITGTYDTKTRKLKLKAIPILYYKTVNVATGIDCFMEGNFTLRISKLESTLTGEFLSEEAHKYTCPPINIRFKKVLKEEPLLIEKVDVIQKEAVITETPQQKVEREATLHLHMRAKDLIRELEVNEDSVRIDLYDNGESDNDSISVFYNNHLVVHKQLLDTRKPISFKVFVDSVISNNELMMYAENLGSIPPNAALMIVTDKHHRYEVTLTSNYQKNAVVRLRKTSSQTVQ